MNELPTALPRAALGVAVALFILAAPAAAIEPGHDASPFDVAALDGQVSLSALRGKLVYLDFWASWCGPCRRSFPWMSRMQARYGARGLQIVAMNVDARRADADAFLATMPPGFAVGFDGAGKVAAAYGIRGMPSSVLIGPDGKVIAVHVGFRDADREALEALLQKHLPLPEQRS